MLRVGDGLAVRARPLGVALACAVLGCGARTGLEAPDPPAPDAASDAPAPLLDAGSAQPPPPPDAAVPELCVRAAGAALDDAAPLELRVAPRVRVADVVLLVDETSSMNDEIENIRRGLLSTIVPGVRAELPGAQFAVASFADFPVRDYGSAADVPFRARATVTERTDRLVVALADITAAGGGDAPEASVEALYQLATNEGYAPWVRPAARCADGARAGALCLRPDAVPLVLVFTDAPAHNGPRVANAYRDADFTAGRRAARGPHTYDEALAALRRVGAAVIGIDSSRGAASNQWSAGPDLEQLARDTGALGPTGAPLVFDIGSDGRGLDGRVVEAVRAFVGSGRLEVSARITSLDGDAVAADSYPPLRPLRAEPAAGAERADAAAFYGVLPGTQLVFAFALPAPTRSGYAGRERRARVQFYANTRPVLGAIDVRVVPLDDSAAARTEPCVDPQRPAERDR